MKRYLSVLLVFFLSLMAFSGCSKDDKSTEPQEQTDPAAIQTVNFTAPQTAYNDQYIQMIKSTVASMNSIMNFPEYFAYRTPAKNGNVYTRTYVNGGFSASLIATVNNDATVWKLILNGIDDYSGEQYNNFLSHQADISNSNKTCSGKLFDSNNNVILTYSWTKGTDNSITGEYKENTGANASRVTAISRADKSGELKIYSGTTLKSESTWNASGAGQMKIYGDSGSTTTITWS